MRPRGSYGNALPPIGSPKMIERSRRLGIIIPKGKMKPLMESDQKGVTANNNA